jgi:multiple sugar transport system substrate-binding protein
MGRDGKFRREYSMGGQGMGISKYSKHVDEAWKFIEWYEQHDQQMRYAKNCQTGRADVMKEPEWLKMNPYNALFAKALLLTNDYWHVPEYAILLDIMQEEVNNAIVKKKTPEQAMKDCAERQERTMLQAGYKIERTAAVEVPDTVVTPVGKDKVEEVQ